MVAIMPPVHLFSMWPWPLTFCQLLTWTTTVISSSFIFVHSRTSVINCMKFPREVCQTSY